MIWTGKLNKLIAATLQAVHNGVMHFLVRAFVLVKFFFFFFEGASAGLNIPL